MESHLVDDAAVQADTEAALDDPTIENVLSAARDYEPLVSELPLIAKETKAGYKTTEFWVSLASAFAIGFGAVPTPHDAKGYALAGIAGLYAIARGLAKRGVPNVEPV